MTRFLIKILFCLALGFYACTEEPEPVPDDSKETPGEEPASGTDPEPENPEVPENPDIPEIPEEPKPVNINILAIGNSFTEDATAHLPGLLNANHEDGVYFGKLILNGSSLEQHWTNYQKVENVYTYFNYRDGKWKTGEIASVNEALSSRTWDIIIFQQVSMLSGFYDSYQPYLDNLIAAVRQTSPKAKIAWQMTWAYSTNSPHSYFYYYHNSRAEMYEAIAAATEKVKQNVDCIIPSGAVIEFLRSTEHNTSTDLTRDGSHLDRGYPCIILSNLWHEVLVTPYTGISTLDKSTVFLKDMIEDWNK